MSIHVECIECGKESVFADAKAITDAKWTILAWNVKSCGPLCVCDECEYGQPKKAK